ncbi:hypothetical protein LX15_000283 [Streptoalloteichus tenebrarius]|uniref:Uncharacterized protein n=1 Tax=Streptoalloteichus tenebrarius (strain ATCC 17920 / DSM 40477 / JCM 4838 / CBS 697.72 / NBRC 16177 / NCIMB 11028 / NRRL B-12390 / A12253. 1 / ISP 5477) TaxID=1933 RepID=A0ABT1HM83_STRSD|nr:hypothetical protein [Streptoalloteichus tenebrarius]MCP2256600.1 hypothetical protein [Streptoalloteichus tenebrarius]BFF04953.1 hypothetical protein GCM10020241_66280 [Streptoalloteichus tenebrarius]
MASLYIKYRSNDTGARPIPPGAAYWESPSMWLTGGWDLSTARPGVPNRIHVRVDNNSDTDISGVMVQIWVSKPIAPIAPVHSMPFPPAPDPNRSHAVFPVGVVRAHGWAVASVDWIPDESSFINPADPNSAHMCLGANCYTHGCPGSPEGRQITSATADFPVVIDPHCGQHNINLRRFPPGGRACFTLGVANPAPTEATFTVTAEELRGDEGLGLIGLAQVLSGWGATITGMDAVEIQRLRNQEFCRRLGEPLELALVRAGGVPVLVDAVATHTVAAAQNPVRGLTFFGDNVLCGAGGREVRVRVRPGGAAPLGLAFDLPDDTRVGGVHTLQVSVRDEKGALLGGVRFLALVVNPQLLTPCA